MSSVQKYNCVPNKKVDGKWMKSRIELSDIDVLLPNVLVPILLVFPLPQPPSPPSPSRPQQQHSTRVTATRQQIVERLRRGLEATAAQIPALAGRVYTDIETKRQYIEIHEGEEGGILLVVNGITTEETDLNDNDNLPSYSSLESSHFAPAAFPLSQLLPLGEFDPTVIHTEKKYSLPACLFQVNFIPGGIILGCAFHHLVSDGPSQDQFFRIWAENIRQSQSQTPHEDAEIRRSQIQLDRSILTSTEKLDKQSLEQIESRLSAVDGLALETTYLTTLTVAAPSSRQRPFKSALLRLSHAECEIFRGQVSQSPFCSSSPSITTFDCVTALMWRCITRAKLSHARASGPDSPFQADAETQTCLYLPIGFRGNHNPHFPSNYFGNALALFRVGPHLISDLPGGQTAQSPSLVDESRSLLDDVARISSEICTRTQGVDMRVIQDLVKWSGSIDRSEPRIWGATMPSVMDLNVTNWASSRCYQECDLGFGLPTAYRAPDVGIEWCCFYPQKFDPDGTSYHELYLGLEEHCHEILRKDQELMKLTQAYILNV